jgi:hypothetical protein
MNNIYETEQRSASIEQQATKDYMVEFVDKETGQSQYETFHTLEKAQDSASRWLTYSYIPL